MSREGKVITAKAWKNYRDTLAKIDKQALDVMQAYAEKHGFVIDDEFVAYAYAAVTKYGEASGALAAQMYDELSEYWDAVNAPAEVAETPSYEEVARAMYGTAKTSPRSTPATASRMVKQVGADTMLKNAIRDGAYFAWIPGGGETCAFCLTLASRGWQRASKKALKNGHAEHIHGHCKCTYAIVFNKQDFNAYKGYDPDKYLKMYEDSEGNTPNEKMRSMRRMLYKDIAEYRNARRRELYKEKKTNIVDPKLNLSTDYKIYTREYIGLKDEQIGKSVGAGFQNEKVIDLLTLIEYEFAPGAKLQNKEVFAGKGTKKIFRRASYFANKYGGNVEDWQHVKAFTTLKDGDTLFNAEVHWSQCSGIGKVEFFIKNRID